MKLSEADATMTATAVGPANSTRVGHSPAASLSPTSSHVLLWGAVGSAIAFVALYLTLVGTAVGQQLDEAAMRRLAAVDSTAWAELILWGVSASSMLVATGVVIAATALLRGRRAAVIGALAAGSVVLVAQLLKAGLERPMLLAGPAGNSFPSGHVAAVLGLGVALVIALPRAGRWAVAVLLVGPVAGLTGLATVVLQWHRPSDVVGSLLLAIAIGALATELADRQPPTRSGSRR